MMKMNTFKLVRIASEIAGMNKDEVRMLADLLIDNKNAETLNFELTVGFQERNLMKEIA
jgi:hypothetical protein